MVVGIDEAGRGPILGPMVLAGVGVYDRQVLSRLGVKDSKQFGSSRKAEALRHELRHKIQHCADFVHVVVVTPAEIDAGNLNTIEQQAALEIIERCPLNVTSIVLDGVLVFSPLRRFHPKVIAENKADQDYLEVAAASIVAKSMRDELFQDICRKYEDAFGKIKGSGYNNEGSYQFIRSYVQRHGDFPVEARRSWSNLKTCLENQTGEALS